MDLEAVRRSVQRGQPYGSEPCAKGSSRALGWASNPPYALGAGPERLLQGPEKDSRPFLRLTSLEASVRPC